MVEPDSVKINFLLPTIQENKISINKVGFGFSRITKLLFRMDRYLPSGSCETRNRNVSQQFPDIRILLTREEVKAIALLDWTNENKINYTNTTR